MKQNLNFLHVSGLAPNFAPFQVLACAADLDGKPRLEHYSMKVGTLFYNDVKKRTELIVNDCTWNYDPTFYIPLSQLSWGEQALSQPVFTALAKRLSRAKKPSSYLYGKAYNKIQFLNTCIEILQEAAEWPHKDEPLPTDCWGQDNNSESGEEVFKAHLYDHEDGLTPSRAIMIVLDMALRHYGPNFQAHFDNFCFYHEID